MDNISFFWIFGAEYLIYLMLFITVFLGIKGQTKDKKAFLLIILSIPISVIFIKIIHLFYFEPRPFITYNFISLVKEANDASFPSRHATISGVLAFSYIYFKSKWALAFIFAAVWVGLSRVYVGVHYPLDIIGGFITAAAALIISQQIFKLIRIFKWPNHL